MKTIDLHYTLIRQNIGALWHFKNHDDIIQFNELKSLFRMQLLFVSLYFLIDIDDL